MKKNNKQKINTIFISIILFSILGGFGANALLNNVNISYNENLTNTNELKTSQIEKTDISIAIYNEPNTTIPSYGEEMLTNNNTSVKTIINNAGFDVDELTTEDIYNHKLTTSKYDIFILNDNLPKVNITNYVLEYWLGGGSLLTFDSAVSFLCYFGIMPPESANDNGNGIYWDYVNSPNQNITSRHPISQDYNIGDSFQVGSEIYFATFYWDQLQSTSIADQITKIATKDGFPNLATVVAFEPTSRGGKVVHILSSYDINNADDLLIQSLQWLCPKPKARIAFDLTHQPRLGVDDWDDLAGIPGYYPTFRDEIVNKGYLFDKLYPSSSGNYTSSRLDLYDVLIIVSPDLNTSASEQNNLNSWIANGGSLLILGERPGGIFLENNKRINFLLKDTGLELNSIYGTGVINNLIFNIHPTTEGCTNIYMGTRGAINISGSAFPIWKYAGNIYIAGQEYGNGRIIITSDINWAADSHIGNDDNSQYAINIMNWLSANNAKILTYIYEAISSDPNDNIYQGPVSKALNILGESFYITFLDQYFNLSLINYDWDLVIIDNTGDLLVEYYYEELLQYLKNGGRLILSTWEYRRTAPIPLWDYLGFENAGDPFTTPPIIHLWSTTHPIFNNPIDYDSTTIETTLDYSLTDASNLTVYNNATSIAGLTSSVDDNGCSIILGAGGKAIVNGFHVTEYSDDTDDSTYPDSLEIWLNEIYYLLPRASQGIPGYNMVIFTGLMGLLIGIISIFLYKKRLEH